MLAGARLPTCRWVMALHVINIYASHAFGQGRELRCAAAWGFRIGVWGDTNQLSAASGKVWQLVVNGKP